MEVYCTCTWPLNWSCEPPRSAKPFLPEGPADDDVSLDGDAERAVDGARLGNDAHGVHNRGDVWEDALVVEREERVLGEPVHGGQAERTGEKLSGNGKLWVCIHRVCQRKKMFRCK